MFKVYCAAIALSLLGGGAATAESLVDLSKPYAVYSAVVDRVIDGDTIVVSVDLWPGLIAHYQVRVRGIDAPEVHRVRCPEEKTWGYEAREVVERLYDVGSEVRLENVELDSFGRAVADVSRYRSDRWLDIKQELLDRDLAVIWTPDMPEIDWCSLAITR